MAINREEHTVPTVVVSPPSLPQGCARIAPIHALGRLIQMQGGDPDAVFSAAKIDERKLADPNGVLPVALRGELMERALEATGCEHFGLLLGAQSGIRELGAAGQLMLELSTVGEALDAFVAFWSLHNPSGVVFVRRSIDQASFGYAVIDGNIPGMPQLQDSAMTFALNIMRDMLGPDWRPTGVSLMRREPRNPAFHVQLLGATLDFRLKKSVARTAVVAQHPPDGHDWSAYVQRVAYRLLLMGECSQKRVAAELGVSDRTLVRKLGSSGLTYQQLFDGARYSASRSLIRETGLTLAEIAAALGYKEPSSFTRAFERWSGMSPARWRKLKSDHAGLLSGKK
jgi:AraC-like DNA-binding protein